MSSFFRFEASLGRSVSEQMQRWSWVVRLEGGRSGAGKGKRCGGRDGFCGWQLPSS